LRKYELARGPKSSRPQVPVDFSVRSARAQDPALLVDFGGGKGAKVTYGSATITEDLQVQLLVLSPKGHIFIRRTQEDLNNEERDKRLKAWKERINELEKGKRSQQEQPIFDKRGPGQ